MNGEAAKQNKNEVCKLVQWKIPGVTVETEEINSCGWFQ